MRFREQRALPDGPLGLFDDAGLLRRSAAWHVAAGAKVARELERSNLRSRELGFIVDEKPQS